MRELEQELKELIVSSLELKDVEADSIESHAALFGEGDGLGLDSIDALELAVVISKKYGVQLQSDDEKTQAIFSSVSTLAEYIGENRQDL